MTPPDSASAGCGELRKVLNILFDDGRIAYANDKSPDVCQQYIDRAEAMVDAYILAEILYIIGKPRPEDSNLYSSRKLRETNGFDATNQLIQKFTDIAIARFGKGGNRG